MVSMKTADRLFMFLLSSMFLLVFAAATWASTGEAYRTLGDYGLSAASYVLQWENPSVDHTAAIWFEGYDQVQRAYWNIALFSSFATIAGCCVFAVCAKAVTERMWNDKKKR